MPLLSAIDLAKMRSVQVDSLHDKCTLRQRMVDGVDPYGMPVIGQPIETLNVACGFKPKKVDEILGNAEVTMIEAELRLPLGTNVTGLDQITLTHRYGELMSEARKYKVNGTPVPGATGIVIQLVKVTE